MNWGRLGKGQSSIGGPFQYWLANEDRLFGSDLAEREVGCGDRDSVMETALWSYVFTCWQWQPCGELLLSVIQGRGQASWSGCGASGGSFLELPNWCGISSLEQSPYIPWSESLSA